MPQLEQVKKLVHRKFYSSVWKCSFMGIGRKNRSIRQAASRGRLEMIEKSYYCNLSSVEVLRIVLLHPCHYLGSQERAQGRKFAARTARVIQDLAHKIKQN